MSETTSTGPDANGKVSEAEADRINTGTTIRSSSGFNQGETILTVEAEVIQDPDNPAIYWVAWTQDDTGETFDRYDNQADAEAAYENSVRTLADRAGEVGEAAWEESDVDPKTLAAAAGTWAGLAEHLKMSYAEQMETVKVQETAARPTAFFSAFFTALSDDWFGPITWSAIAVNDTGEGEMRIDLLDHDVTPEWAWDLIDAASNQLQEFGVVLDWAGCRTEEESDDEDDHTSGWEPTYPATRYLTAHPFIVLATTDKEG